MWTLRTLARAALVDTVGLGVCATHTAGAEARDGAPAVRVGVRLDNQSGQWIDDYLIEEPREWHLGRVAPGRHGLMRLPVRTAPSSGAPWMVRLAVIAGAPRVLQPSRDSRAITSEKRQVTTLVGQRWTFTQGQLISQRTAGR